MKRVQLLVGIVVLAVVALGGAAYYVYSGSSSSDAASEATNNIVLAKDDHTMGSAKAPITIIEYAAPTCPHCAHFDMDVFPQFKQAYVDTGKVFFVFRVFPLNAVDVAAQAMAECLPKSNYFSFLDMLYRNQPKWDPDGYQIADVHAALVQMGNLAGLTSAQVDGCISDQAETQRIQNVGQQAQTLYGIHQTPTFLVDRQIHYFVTLADVQAVLDPLLRGKKQASLAGRPFRST